MSPTINKFLVALATAIATISVLISDNSGMSTSEWLAVALSVLGAIGVYAVPNASKNPNTL